MTNNIVIFGGGIGGLTVAHELVEKGFKVTLIEQDKILGGMARSRREEYSIPSEHSWRGYAPFYANAFDIMKRIPISCNSQSKTVYDNLTVPITFYVTRDKISSYNSSLGLSDYFVIGYLLVKYLSSDSRREEYFKTKITDLLKNKLTPDAYTYLVDFINGPGYGMEKKDASYAHYFKPLSIYVLNNPIYKQIHQYPYIYTSQTNEKWHVMNAPTNEAWFDHWEKYLVSQGVKIIKGIGLKKINWSGSKISGCVLTNGDIIIGDDYVLCINPFASQEIFARSGLNNLEKTFKSINKNTDSRQVSFRLGFSKKIKFPQRDIAFIFPDSEFNITLYPQEQSWDPDIKLSSNYKQEIQSLWSGTILELYRMSKLFKSQGYNLSKDQLIQEIVYQVLRSKSLQKLIFDSNGFELTNSDIVYTEIWYEWDKDPLTSQLTQSNKKWVTNIYNQKERPEVKTEFSNLYLGGSHIKTSIEVWSMEGAVESGKMVANEVLKKYSKDKTFLHKHKDPKIFNILKQIDNLLFKLGLPNIIDCLIFILMVCAILCIKNK